MKWSYYIFLVFSAWMYHRVVFHSPTITENSRAPASLSSESCIDLMQDFYPNQSKEFLKKRIAANKNFHSFYRSFVPFFYEAIQENQKINKSFIQLSKYKAAMGGDVHTENFGFVITPTGSARLVLNDIDDVTAGPIYMDVLRHYISGKIVAEDVHWKNYINAYMDGLRGDDHVYSDYIKRNRQSATAEAKKFIDEYISSDLPIKFIKYKTPMYVIDDATKKEILASLKKDNFKIKIYDQYLRIKEDGGSAGLLRYQVLAQISPGEDPVWLDIKELTISSYDKVFRSTVPTSAQRMSLIKGTIYQEDVSSHLSLIKIAGKDFSVRYMNQFALGIQLEDVSHLELADVVLDEAYVLGQMHARGLQTNSLNIENYTQDWNNISAEDIKKAAREIREVLEKKYTSKI